MYSKLLGHPQVRERNLKDMKKLNNVFPLRDSSSSDIKTKGFKKDSA